MLVEENEKVKLAVRCRDSLVLRCRASEVSPRGACRSCLSAVMRVRLLKGFDYEHCHVMQAAVALYELLSALASSIPFGLWPLHADQAVVVESCRHVALDLVALVGEVLTVWVALPANLILRLMCCPRP